MASAILGLLAETSLYAGASTSSGVVDLPIQREAHTGWPCVFGSGVKGALRTAAHDLGAEWEDEVFGPPSSPTSDYAGAIAVSDARLLLLPVRSLTGYFKWVTCPALLERALADCKRLNINTPDLSALNLNAPGLNAPSLNPSGLSPSGHGETGEFSFESLEIANEDVVLPLEQNTPDGEEQFEVERLFLEELSFIVQRYELTELLRFLALFLNTPKAEAALRKQLAIVNNNTFAYLSQFATPVNAHIAIEYATKTVKDGALWYEETLPPDTVLYSCLLAHRSRKKDSERTALQVLNYVTQDMFSQRPYLQIGGNETVGMGWCKVAVVPSSTADATKTEAIPSQSADTSETVTAPQGGQ